MLRLSLLLFSLWLLLMGQAYAVERALVALPHDTGVYLSWRLLAQEPIDTAFDLYRVVDNKKLRVNDEPIVATTDYVDPHGNLNEDHNWFVTVRGSESPSTLAMKPKVTSLAQFQLPIGQQTHAGVIAIADLNNDQRQDLIVRYPGFSADPYHRLWQPSPGTYKLAAVDSSGRHLWTYDMGAAIEMGIWYAPFVAHDLDGDGAAELIVKAGGEKDVDKSGKRGSERVLTGEEHLRVISGSDGRTVLAQASWPDRSGYRDGGNAKVGSNSYADYNRWSRNFIAIAYLKPDTPHVIVSRGTYGKHKVSAYAYQRGQLEQVWSWENVDPKKGGEKKWWGQGAHSLQAQDLDGDGRDEVILGGIILDHSGKPLWSLAKGHVDHVYVGDLSATNPGKELYYGSEKGHARGGIGMVDAASGSPIWVNDWRTHHIHREGMCADIDADHEGLECFSGEAKQDKFWLFASNGTVLKDKPLSRQSLDPLTAFWDGDRQKEIIQPIAKAEGGVFAELASYGESKAVALLPVPFDTARKDYKYLNTLAVADILGDWREEILVADRGRVLVYVSNLPAQSRYPWLMQDHSYQLGVTNASSGYYQQPIVGALFPNTNLAHGAHNKKH